MLKSHDRDLLHGSLVRKIFEFTGPLIITNLVYTLYNAADMVIVGLSGVEGAIGAIGTTVALIHLMLNIFNGLSLGSGIIVARYIGEGNPEKIGKAVHTSMITGLFSGLICMAAGLLLSRPALMKMGDTGHILDLASTYTRIYFFGVPFLALTNFLTAIFQAKGDTDTTLKVLLSSGMLNVILNCIFVIFCKMSVDGVALATSLSNLVSALILTICLMRDSGVCRLSFSKLKFDKRSFRQIMGNGVPAGIQASMFSLSNVLIQSSVIGVNNLLCPGGSAVIDGVSAATSFENIASSVTGSILQTSMTFTSQHYGAHAIERLKKVVLNCFIVGLMLSTVCGASILLLRKPLLSLYHISDSLAISSAEIRMLIILATYPIYGCMETGQGILRGLGKSLQTTVISMLGIGVLRVVLIKTFAAAQPSLQRIYISYPISWFVTGAVYLVIILSALKKLQSNHPVR